MNHPARRRHVFAWSAVFGYGAIGFTLARNVLLVPLYLHYITLGEYGAWLATGGALAQLLVADFGLSGVLMQKVAASAGGRDVSAIRGLVVAGLVNALLLALLLGAASALLAAWLPATQGLDAAQRARVLDCYLIAVAANSFGVIAMAATAALRGAQRTFTAGALSLIADIASVAVTMACVFTGHGLYGIAVGLLTRSVLAAAGGLIALRSCWRDSTGRFTCDWQRSRELWRDSAQFFLTSIAMRLQSQANILFVGSILGPHTAAIYGLTVRAHEMVHIVMGQLNSAFAPALAHLAGAGEHERFQAVIRRLLPLVAALAAVCVAGVVVLNESFIDLWAGREAYGGFALTALMGVALWITSIAFVGYEVMLARGEFPFIARAFAVGSCLHLLVLGAGLPLFGFLAAPVALLCSSMLWGSLLWRRSASFMPETKALRAALAEAALVGAAGAAAAAVLLVLLPAATSWPALAAEMFIAAFSVGGLLMLVRPGLRRSLFDEIAATWRSMRAA